MRRGRKKKNRNARSRRWIKRILIFVFVIPIALIVLAILLVLLYPGEKAGALLSRRLSVMMARPVHVDKLKVNPFRGVDARGVRVGFTQEEGVEGDLIGLERLGIRYRVLPLLRRRLEITDVLLEKPRLKLVTPESTIPEAIPPGDSVAAIPPLPLAFGLFRLDLNHFRFDLTIPDSAGDIRILLYPVHLFADQLRVPRNFIESPEELRGRLHLSIEEGRFVFENPAVTFDTEAELDLVGSWNDQKNWRIGLECRIQPVDSSPDSRLALQTAIGGLGYGEEIRIDTLALSLGGQNLLNLEGAGAHLGIDMTYDFTVDGDAVNIRKLRRSLTELLPAPWLEPVEGLLVEGSIELIEGHASGSLTDIRIDARSRLRDGRFSYPGANVSVTGNDLDLRVRGFLDPEGITDGIVGFDARIGSARYTLNDTTVAGIDGVSLSLNTVLDRSFLPSRGSIVADVSHLLGGDLDLKLAWSSVFTDTSVEDFRLEGNIRADSMQVEAFPGIALPVSGLIHMDSEIQGDGLDELGMRWIFRSDGIDYSIGQDRERTPPLNLLAEWKMKIDSSYRVFTLQDGVVRLNDWMSADVNGVFDVSDSRFHCELEEVTVENEALYRHAPDFLRSQMGGLEWSGKEVAGIVVDAHQIGDSTAVFVQGGLRLVSLGIVAAQPPIRVEGIEGSVDFFGSPVRFDGMAEVSIGRLTADFVRTKPITGIRMFTNWVVIPGDSLWTESGRLEMPSLGVEARMTSGIGQMASSPRMYGDVEFAFSSRDSTELIDGMTLIGNLNGELEAEMWEDGGSMVRLGGRLNSDSLGLSYQDILQASGISARLPFDVEFDLQNFAFSTVEDIRPFPWIDYARRRLVYQHLIPDLGVISAEKVVVAGYPIHDIAVDIKIDNGLIQIPFYDAGVYGGNIGGFMWARVVDGQWQNLSYEIRGQASRINSTAFTEGRLIDEEETELNATLAFRGRGLDLAQGIDLDGTFHITKIGSDFASVLLEGIDPTGSDRSIRLTRKLLNTGWKPRLFSFELRHGYVYPSIELDQPWFSPIRIPDKLTYGRLPLAFFIKPRENQ